MTTIYYFRGIKYTSRFVSANTIGCGYVLLTIKKKNNKKPKI